MGSSAVLKSFADERDSRPSISVFLVDDQPIIAQAIGQMFEDQPDIRFRSCTDPDKMLDMAEEFKPTCVLQDWAMPGIAGATLVQRYRENPATVDVPLIVLSTQDDPSAKAEAFASGANDYLIKLPEKAEFLARIRHHSRGYIALQERNLAFEALCEELADAGEYVVSTLPRPLEGNPKTDWLFRPSIYLGGDIFGYHDIDEDHFAVYLIDVCGHGVGAAMLSVSVANVLKAQSLPDIDFTDPAEVLGSLNKAFPMEEHNNLFFSIWYGIHRRSENRLVYSSGGHPPAVLLTGPKPEEAVEHRLSTGGVFIGAQSSSEYHNDECRMDVYSSLFVFSDGAYEVVKKTDGNMWTLDLWVDLLVNFCRNRSDDIQILVREVEEIQGSEKFDDDFSLLRVVFNEADRAI